MHLDLTWMLGSGTRPPSCKTDLMMQLTIGRLDGDPVSGA